MELICPHCQQLLSFPDGGARPSFCGFCGQRLTDSSSGAVASSPRTAIAAQSTEVAPAAAVLPPETDIKLAETLVSGPGDGPSCGPASADQLVGEYRLRRILGQGGMGVVWEAEHVGGGRRVALKLLAPNLPHTPETVERFLREARAAAALSHPRSTFVFGAGQHQGQPYLAMELMPGRTLQDEIRTGGPMSVTRAVDHILDVIAGLEAAHSLDLIHRDVKPSNCFFDSEGRVKVGDFGLSKSLVSDATLTRTGAFLGTPQFAAPEQVRGEEVDRRTDVYSVGATLFYLLTGKAPFSGDAVAVIAQIASENAPPVRSVRPDLPETLNQVLRKALARNPSDRYGDLRQLRHALSPFASGGVSLATVGRRLAAYMIDNFTLAFASGLIGATAANLTTYFSNDPIPFGVGASPQAAVSGQLAQGVLAICWFGVAESVWGRAVGKRLMGLRVVDAHGEKPALWRSMLRAFVVPGAFGMVLLATAFYFWRIAGSDERLANNPLALAAGNYSAYLGWIVVLVCLLPMRAKNGYRGLHDLLSGTRVVRVQTRGDTNAFDAPLIAPAAAAAPLNCGPYEAVGVLGQCGSAAVWLGKDDLLGRTAWIFTAPPPVNGDASAPPTLAPSEGRRRIERPTRLRWLQGDRNQPAAWQAFEAVRGAALVDLLAMGRQFEWRQGRRWLLDLAEELAACQHDEDALTQLSLEQVWIDRSNRVKLLDAPLARPRLPHPAGEEAAPAAVEGTAAEGTAAAPHSSEPQTSASLDPVGLLAAVAERCSSDTVLPRYASEFREELARRAASGEPAGKTLDWAVQSLKETADRPVRIAWDDRLGMLCASFGVELSPYMMICMLLPTASILFLDAPVGAAALGGLLLCLALPAALGALFRGGPLLRILHIEVLDSRGKQASRLQCAWRNVLVWTPILTTYTVMATLLVAPFVKNSPWFRDEAAQQAAFNPFENPPALLAICGTELLALVFVAGVIYSLVRPQRGLQDLMAGTRLAPM